MTVEDERKKPSKGDLQRGGFNPLPAKEQSKPKEQFGPTPTDAPSKGAERAGSRQQPKQDKQNKQT